MDKTPWWKQKVIYQIYPMSSVSYTHLTLPTKA